MKILTFSLVSTFAMLGACSAGELDPRFDGKWQGIESLSGYFVRHQLDGSQNPAHIPALIAISDSGQTIGVIRGLTVGRYDVSPKSHGNILVFKLNNMHPNGLHVFYGRTDGKLTLSSDGNTLTETSNAILPGTHGPINCILKGILHRIVK
jgi:bacillopeptidase F (M6 metalloprotease family)